MARPVERDDRPRKFDEQIRLRVKVDNDRIWDIMTGDYVEIDQTNLDAGLMDQSKKVHWINVVYVGARFERNRLKRSLDLLEAKLRDKALLVLGDEKKPTEKAIDAWIIQQPEYEALWDKLERADRELGQINGVKEGLRDRRDMLVAINLNDRREREQDLGKTVAQQKAREMDEQYRRRLRERERA